jgi:hypothetical protein
MALSIDCGEGKHMPVCSGTISGASYLLPQTADQPDRPCACSCHQPPAMSVLAQVAAHALEQATDVLVRHSRCRLTVARTGDGKVIYDCGIAVPGHLASHHAHQAAALAAEGLLS